MSISIENPSAILTAKKVYELLCFDYLNPTKYTVSGRTPASIQRSTKTNYPALIEVLTIMVQYELLESRESIDGYISYRAKNIPEIIKKTKSKFLFIRYCNVYISGFNFYYS
ncbi:hypothetical protein [Photobacterium sanguinicancri]|uniref:hypothetical protein n=1 Tax=Photobacterium sanguinicancri TaxID=875932 RepID=UPI003D13B0C0